MIQSIFYNNPDYYPPIINSAYVLADAGFQHELLCRSNLPETGVKYPTTLKLVRLEGKTPSSWWGYFDFIHQVIRSGSSRADLFIGHDMHGFLAARLLGWRYRKPVIYHCHDFVDNDQRLSAGGAAVKAFERRFARTADIVIVPDRERAEVIKEQLELQKFPTIVANAPLAVPGAGESLLHKTLQAAGRFFDKIVLRQGSIGEGHCIDVTIQSLPLWQDKRWGFVVMGLGTPAYKEKLIALAQQLGVQDQFVILPPVSYKEVLKYTLEADLGHALYQPHHINNQYITTASNKIMEYIAAGIPVLMSDTESSRGFLEKYKAGISADVTSPQAIANAVNQILSQPEYAFQLGRNGKYAFEHEFRYDLQYAKVLQALGELRNANIPVSTPT